jgi:hypothetical protein
VPALDLDELVRRKVHDKLAEMNGRLGELVAAELDRELDRVVAAELELRVNGDAAAHAEPEAPVTKVCSGCGQAKPPTMFEAGRRRCRTCRREQRHPRKQPADAAGEEPHPAPSAKRHGRFEPLIPRRELFDREARRELIASTPAEPVVDGNGRTWFLKRLPAVTAAAGVRPPAPLRR